MKVPGITIPDVEISTGISGQEMAILMKDSNLVLKELSAINDALSVPKVIAQSNIPFLIMPGDGGANGCSFSGSAGAFTLSAAILANIGTALAGCYAYFSANFGGSTLPAGWYWTEFSSDTAGIVYAETYTSGTPRRPASPTPISVNLTGRITATTNEIVGPSGFILLGNALGKNGTLQTLFSMAASTSGTHSYRGKIDTTVFLMAGNSTSPVAELLYSMSCCDSNTRKICSRNASNANGGVGLSSATAVAASSISVDTSIDQNISFSLQQSTSVAGAILMRALVTATYGA
jgi:hypothetical protein